MPSITTAPLNEATQNLTWQERQARSAEEWKLKPPEERYTLSHYKPFTPEELKEREEDAENFSINQDIRSELLRLGVTPNGVVQPKYGLPSGNRDGLFLRYCKVPKHLNRFKASR